MALEKYKEMRRFDETPEPSGEIKKATGKRLEFVIQKHHASRLHYDFRLELEGVMKSWAVPKGPSLNPEDKRLAMHVEDHPIQYNKFEGVIPEGNYGAGNVIIWDRGYYEPAQISDKSKPGEPAMLEPYKGKDVEKHALGMLEKGDFKFIMHGEKIKGAYVLVKTKGFAGKDSWLLIKKDDEYASKEDVTRQDKSVVSGKPVDDMGAPDKIDIDKFPKSRMPKNVKPMLATLVDEAFDKADWLYELKWDGYRAIGSWDGKEVGLYSRNGNDFKTKYPPISEALHELKHEVVLDGEIVAVDEDGRAHFEWLQNYKSDPQGQLLYYVFDILWCDGRDLRDQPLTVRKQLLQKVIPAKSILRYSDHIETKGVDFYKLAEKQNLEGIMAKAGDSRYSEGARSKQWLKIKTHLRQEAVIGGFTEPRGGRKHIGALILGVYDGDDMVYVGHTGGGIPTDQLKPLREKLEKIQIDGSPFVNKFKPNSTPHWVKPKYICEVSFGEWTGDGHMRQPIFVGLRSDKEPKDIKRELPKEALPKTDRTTNTAAKAKYQKPNTKSQKLEFTHRDKVFFPEKKYTKGDLIDYYQSVADVILPYIKDRPCNLLRMPNGITGQSFFQKDMDKHPEWVETKAIYSESNEKDIHYMICKDKDHLLYMVQLGSVEINPWNSREQSLDKPDWVVIDLDPDDNPFTEVIEAALVTKQICDELKIPCYPKTSGKTGIHIFIPTAAKYGYEQVKTFAQIIATMVNERLPKFTSILRIPAKRKHKIYVDFLQNREGQTLAAPYSVRPTPEASVSTPLHWDEVNKKLDPKKFTIKNTQKRLDEVSDLWKPVIGKGIDLKQTLKQLE